MKRSIGEPRSMCVLACIAWCIVTGLDRKLKPKDKEKQGRQRKQGERGMISTMNCKLLRKIQDTENKDIVGDKHKQKHKD